MVLHSCRSKTYTVQIIILNLINCTVSHSCCYNLNLILTYTLQPDADPLKVPKTAVSKELVMKIGEAISNTPPNFEVHPKLKTVLQHRNKLLSSNQVNWAMAEALAFGTLISVRIIY